MPTSMFCNLCGEPEGAGQQHDVDEIDARLYQTAQCDSCGTACRVRCVLGHGDFVYICVKCERRRKDNMWRQLSG